MKKFIIFIVAVCIVGAAGLAVAKLASQSPASDQTVEETGPNGCSKSMEPVDFWLTSFDKTRTYFKIPKAYLEFYKHQYSGGGVSSINLNILLKDFSPSCLSYEYIRAYNNNDNKSNIALTLSITDGMPFTPTSDWGGRYKEENPDYVGTSEQGFKIYRNKAEVAKIERRNISGFDDVFLPSDDMFDKPTIVICHQAYDVAIKDFKYTTCKVWQHYEPHLNLSYIFHYTQLKNVFQINKNVDALLQKLIVDSDSVEKPDK